ncbi:mitochondrial ribosomal protein S11 [Rhodnius prolixus]|uniref:mitochondrial ribosomal protein S11 n=1 Tax=Rhodnius prolixus TaxID=13249 RepID=UPI003D18F164
MFLNRTYPLKNLFEVCERFYNLSKPTRFFHTSFICHKLDERRRTRQFISSIKDEGAVGESSVNIDALIKSREDMFPTENTPKMLFNGIPFSKIPICNIKSSKNNTIISLNDANTGEPKAFRTCGAEGFKHTRKGTNIAAQATAITFGMNVKKKGFTTIRVRVRGLGPGRMSAIKGLEMAGLNIVSITDNTPVSWNPPRPRKQRRL